MEKRVSFHTLGCKLNFAETAMYSKDFVRNGFTLVDFKEPADVVVINTCSVTENADKEARKLVRQVKRRSPEARIVVVGCYAQLQPQSLSRIGGVELILGAAEKFNILEYLTEDKSNNQIHCGDIASISEFREACSGKHSGRTRAFLKIQDGCDYSCSFCTIPMARGRSRSQSQEQVIRRIQNLVDSGFKEIILSGVNVGDYKDGLQNSFLKLIQRIECITGEFRIRISSIEPNLLSDEIINFVSSSNKFCHHFHIPLQSGSMAILKSMKRRYNLDLFRNRIESICSSMRGAGIGIDVIAGFPGETDEHFQETIEFLSKIEWSYLHVFTYSERPGTVAVLLPDSVQIQIRKARNEVLRQFSDERRQQFNQRHLGSIENVLFETEEAGGYMTGFTDNYIRVVAKLPYEVQNKIIRVQLVRCVGDKVFGSRAE